MTQRSAIKPSRFSVLNGRNRKTCKWCGQRAYCGITIRRNNLVRGFVCYECLTLVYRFAVKKKTAKDEYLEAWREEVASHGYVPIVKEPNHGH